MYRTAPPGFPPNPLLVTPGEGLRGVLVGRASAADVLREFGEDCQVHRHGNGEIFQIRYEADARGEYLPTRPAQKTRPERFEFEYGLLDEIHIGPYQSELYTGGGIHYGSSRDDVIEAFGDDYAVIDEGEYDSLRYAARGIELSFSMLDPFGVSSYVVFRAAR